MGADAATAEVWIEGEDGRVVLSEWRVALLEAVGRHGSLAAQRLAARTIQRDLLLWVIFLARVGTTAIGRAELAEFIVLGGVLVVVIKAPPAWLSRGCPGEARDRHHW